MNIIAAVDKNWAIGKNNELLVRIPMDQKFFRETTTGKVVVMGRKTLESFPNGLPMLHILQKSTMHMTRMRISRIWMKNRSGKLQQTVKNRHILIWNFISINMKECRSNE